MFSLDSWSWLPILFCSRHEFIAFMQQKKKSKNIHKQIFADHEGSTNEKVAVVAKAAFATFSLRSVESAVRTHWKKEGNKIHRSNAELVFTAFHIEPLRLSLRMVYLMDSLILYCRKCYRIRIYSINWMSTVGRVSVAMIERTSSATTCAAILIKYKDKRNNRTLNGKINTLIWRVR